MIREKAPFSTLGLLIWMSVCATQKLWPSPPVGHAFSPIVEFVEIIQAWDLGRETKIMFDCVFHSSVVRKWALIGVGAALEAWKRY